MDFPLLVSVTSLALMALSIWVGDALRKRAGVPKDDGRTEAAGIMAAAILTLLFFIIGFSFSMAINRYDLRKNCEQAEAIAIGTANAESHVQGRCDCLPSRPGDMPYIVCAISCPYLLPARWTLPRPRASLHINGLDEPRKIAQRVASGMGRCSPECFVPEHCGPSAPRHADPIRLPSAVTNLDSEKHSVDF